jgi:raffinose/stachyose/melibiose transport system substrate-binding protein
MDFIYINRLEITTCLDLGGGIVMNKKILTTLGILMILVFLFTSCGQFTGSDADADKSGKVIKSGQKIELEFFQQKREVADIISQIIEDFEDEHPDITIEQNNIPDAGTVLKSRVASGDVPDILSHWFNPDSRLLIDEGYLRDLTNEPFMAKILPEYLEFIEYKGKYWMVPVSINFVGVFYNVDIFNEHDIKVPTTLSDLYATFDQLKAAGIQPLMVTDKEQWTIGHAGTVVMENMFDVTKFLDVIHGDLSVRDIDGFSNYIDWLEKTRKEYTQPDYLGTAYEAGLGDFANGKAAMLIQGNWIIPILKKANPDFNFGIFPFPAEKMDDTTIHWGIDYTICLNSKPESDIKDEAALKFIEYFINSGAQTWADMDGSISCIEGVKSGLPEYSMVTDLIFSGNTMSGWFTDTWPAGAYDQFNIVQQEFINNFDVDSFYQSLDETLKDYKDK